MALHPENDKIKVRISKDQFGLGIGNGAEHGVVVEVPDEIIYLGFHSFAFENSITDQDVLGRVIKYYKGFVGKIVYWEALQDKGRRFKEGDEEFVLLNMTDVIATDDQDEATAHLIDDIRSGGFKL